MLCAAILAALMALQAGFYATAVLLGLIGLWIAISVVLRLAAGDAPMVRREPKLTPVHALQAELVMLRALLDQLPAPIVIGGGQGVWEAVNSAARRLFRTEGRLLDPPRALQALSTETSRLGPQLLTLSNGEEERSYVLSITDAVRGGESVRLAVMSDVQSELRAAEARALRDLLQVLSHEIMNSLTPVASLADSAGALMDGGDPMSVAAARDAVRTIGRRAAGLNRFVQAYRDLARLPEPIFRPEPIAAVLADARRLFESRWAGRGVTLTLVDLTEAGTAFNLDRDLVTQALINLMVNGAEAALAGGDAPTVSLVAEKRPSHLEFRVHDSGPDVAPAAVAAMFQPFFTTKADGSGVGLTIARQIALSHGGDLFYNDAKQGVGKAFVFKF